MTRAEAAEAALPDTDLIPVVIGKAQRRAGCAMEEKQAIRARKQFGALLDYAKAASAALREVAAFPCASNMAGKEGWWSDCRQREAEAMGGTLPPEVQRRHWCARCVAKDAVERLDSGDVGPAV